MGQGVSVKVALKSAVYQLLSGLTTVAGVQVGLTHCQVSSKPGLTVAPSEVKRTVILLLVELMVGGRVLPVYVPMRGAAVDAPSYIYR